MAYALFNENSYEYLDENNRILFSIDNTHIHLFDYITKDLSCLSELLERYILQKIDIETFELKEQTNDTSNISRIREILTSAHPYYIHEYRKVILNAIGDYFNKLLVYSFFHSDSKPKPDIEKKEWYTNRITALMEPLLQPDEHYPTDFYNNLKQWIDPEAYKIEEFLIPDIPSKRPTGFYSEIKTQTSVYNMLYFILDISAAQIGELTMHQRAWLYGNIFQGEYKYLEEPAISEHISFLSPLQPQYGHNSGKQLEDNKIARTFLSLHDIQGLNIGRDGIPIGKAEPLDIAIEYAKAITTTTIYRKHEIDNLYQLLFLEIITMIESNIMIRTCKNCGKYFVVNNRKIVYCDRIDESGACCSAIGSNRSFQQKLEEDEALKIYTRAYKTHFARVRKKKMTQEDFSDWCSNAKKNLNKVRQGELAISTFQEWLKK